MSKWYSNIFAQIYDPFMYQIEKKIFATKRHLLLHRIKGKVLDVGSGTGANFPYFSKQAQVTAIEPNQRMWEYAQKKIPDKNNIQLILGGIGDENINFPENHFDAIVSTLVLCTIPDPQKALIEFKKWLKPNGRLILIEHIRSHHKWAAFAQDVINPPWKLIAGGCNLNRNTDKWVREAGFEPIDENYFRLGFRWFEGEYVIKT